MELNTKKIILGLIIMAIICFLMLINDKYFAYLHESAHEQISVYHGCIDPYIELNKRVEGYTYFECLEYADWVTNETLYKEYQLHAINEIVSYNLLGVVNYLGILIIGGFVFHAVVTYRRGD